MTRPNDAQDGVELRLAVNGRLGDMDYSAVLEALQASWQLLDRTAHRVLGDRAAELRWHLTSVREGSIETLVRTTRTERVTDEELREVLQTYVRDVAAPSERLPEEDMPVLRDALRRLQETDSGSLVVQIATGVGMRPSEEIIVEPRRVLPTLIKNPAQRQQVIGSITGRLDSINVHGRHQASLWDELDQRRVTVTFAEADYEAVKAALRQRVELFGVIQEDADGRAVRLRMQTLEIQPSDDQLPTLGSLIGSMPDLTGGMTPEEYLERSRREMGLG
jgi:hypothetical protein